MSDLIQNLQYSAAMAGDDGFAFRLDANDATKAADELTRLRAIVESLGGEERAREVAGSPTWPHVLAFALKMEHKLSLNRHKGDRDGWLADHYWSLSARVYEEMRELEGEMAHKHATADAWFEAADVANMAMMTADSYAESIVGKEADRIARAVKILDDAEAAARQARGEHD